MELERRERSSSFSTGLSRYLATFIFFMAAIFRYATTARNSIIELPEFSQN